MKASTRGRYGLRTMLELAISSGGGYLSISQIARRQGVSENYLHQVFSMLQKSGLVKSLKGPQGGYALARPPASISVADILDVLEGHQSIIEPDNCSSDMELFLKDNIWDPIDEKIRGITASITLSQLMEEYKTKNENALLSYYV